MAGIVVSPRARLFHGHEWVYASEVRKTFGDPQPGDVVSLKDFKDRPLGSGIYNPNSQIVVRRFSRRRQDLDADFFRRRIQRALAYRATLAIDPRLIRLIWSESDGLPGVIVDRYGDHLVLQTQTLAMDQRRERIAEILNELLQPQSIVERNDNPMRAAEGLENRCGTLLGQPPEPFSCLSGELSFSVDLMEGQKTGLYLDQLENHQKVARLAKGRRVLDAFCHQGGFALACKKAGAAYVRGIDISERAIASAAGNATANGLEADFAEGNVFNAFRAIEKTDERFDLIILDPPSFTRNKKSLNDALRGYKDIHLRALRLLEPNGILATFSCSHHIDHATYLSVIQAASVDAKRNLRRIAAYTQRADHPIIATLPETEYLRGFAFESIGSW